MFKFVLLILRSFGFATMSVNVGGKMKKSEELTAQTVLILEDNTCATLPLDG